MNRLVAVAVLWVGAVLPALAASPKLGLRDAIDRALPEEQRAKDGIESFSTLDERNGFARLIGSLEGHVDLFLFRGEPASFLVKLTYACSPACSQDVDVFRLSGEDAPVRVSLKDWIDFSAARPLAAELEKTCVHGEGRFEGSDPVHPCPFVFSFPKKGGGGDLYRYAGAAGESIVDHVKLLPQLTFKWDGTHLVASKVATAKPVVLDARKIQALF
jgi:hypothetical protein